MLIYDLSTDGVNISRHILNNGAYTGHLVTNVCDFPPVNTGFQFMHGLIYTGFVYSEFYDHIHIILDYPECDTHNILLIQA